MHSEVMVIGATGMLASATEKLAEHANTVTFTARSSGSISSMSQRLKQKSISHFGLKLDWNHKVQFISELVEHCEKHGYPSLILAWLHDDLLGPEIAYNLAGGVQNIAFFQVRGSAAANPSSNHDAFTKSASSIEGVDFHQIVLGFVVEGNRSRWLTHAEISHGVLEAIHAGRRYTIVGTVEPWQDRP